MSLYRFNDCIPIINYDDDGELDDNGKLGVDQLYILSDNKQAIGIRDTKQSFISPLTYKKKLNDESFTVFVFSQSGNSNFIVDELYKYSKLNRSIVTCFSYSYKDDIEKISQHILISTNEENSNDAIDLDIVKVAEVLAFEEESITFSCKSELVQSFYFASNKTSMCIGVKFNNCNDILFLCDEMDKANEITLRRNDELVLITY